MRKIIVSLTVIHTRLARLHLTLRSLLSQGYSDIEVRVHASKEPFLLDQGAREVPDEIGSLIAEDSRLSWRWVPNIGSYRKLLPVLVETIDEDQLIVTADDDTIYPDDWLSTLLQYYSLFNCIVSFRGHYVAFDKEGFAPYRRWMTHGIVENPSERVLPTGKDGVLYHTSFFDRRVLDYAKALQLAPTADDLWFKWHTAVNSVPVYCVEPDYTKGSMKETSDGPSLYLQFNQAGANDTAVARLHHYAKTEMEFDFPKQFARRRLASVEPVRPRMTSDRAEQDSDFDRRRLASAEAQVVLKSEEYNLAKEELKAAKENLSRGADRLERETGPPRREPRTLRTFFRKVRRIFRRGQ